MGKGSQMVGKTSKSTVATLRAKLAKAETAEKKKVRIAAAAKNFEKAKRELASAKGTSRKASK